MIPAPGRRIGRYELVSLLGTGGAGEVWHAVLHGPHGFRRAVALKLLLPARTDTWAREQLIEEARLGAQVSHPNVVGTFELDEVDGRLLVAMELVRGASAAMLLQSGPLPARIVVEIGVQACQGLHHIHHAELDGGRGLVHRDIKPSNLLVDLDGQLKVADLGIARPAEVVATRAWGTPGYMAPEQIHRREDARADLFALGVTLHQLALGVLPFGTGKPALSAVARADDLVLRAPFLEALDAVVPGLGPILSRAMRADPAARWPDAASFGRALAGLRAGLAREPSGLAERVRTCIDAPPPPEDASTDAQDGIPRMPGSFVGRDEDGRDLAELLALGVQRIAVLGPGGVGKSRLVAEKVRGAAVRWVDLGDVKPPDAVRAVADAVGVRCPDGVDPVAAVGLALEHLAPLVLVLDDADAAVDPAVGRWVERAPALQVVVTRRAWEAPGDRIVLSGLSADAALALFADRGGDAGPEGRQIVDTLGGLPLAIELAAAASRGLTAERLRELVFDTTARLSLTDERKSARHRSLRASVVASVDRLSEDDQVALLQLSVFAGAFSADDARKVAGAGSDTLERLVDRWLLRPLDLGRFALPPEVRIAAYDRLDPDDRWVAEVRHGRRFAWYGTEEALTALRRAGGAARAAELRRVADDLELACARAVARSDGDVAARAALAGAVRALAASASELAGRLLESALTVATGPERRRVQHELALIWATRNRGSEAVALLADARATLDATDALAAGRQALTEARVLFRLARPAEAEPRFREALAALVTAGALQEEAVAHGGYGALLHQQGRLGEAEVEYQRSLAVARETGDRLEEGLRLANLGVLLSDKGDLMSALPRYEAALTIYREFEDRAKEALVLGNLGGHAICVGDLAEGERRMRAALALHRATGAVRAAAVCSLNLGIVAFESGRIDAARAWFEAGLLTGQATADRRVEGSARIYLAELWRVVAPERAVDAFAEAIPLLVGSDRRNEAVGRANHAAALREAGRLDEAAEGLAAALTIADELGPALAGWARLEQVRLCLARLDLAGAEAALRAAGDRWAAHDDPLDLARLAAVEAEVARAAGRDPADAVRRVRAVVDGCGLLPTSPLGRWLAGFTGANSI